MPHDRRWAQITTAEYYHLLRMTIFEPCFTCAVLQIIASNYVIAATKRQNYCRIRRPLAQSCACGIEVALTVAMEKQPPSRQPWGEQRVRIARHAKTILAMLEEGHSAASIRRQLGLEHVPVRTFQFHARKLRKLQGTASNLSSPLRPTPDTPADSIRDSDPAQNESHAPMPDTGLMRDQQRDPQNTHSNLPAERRDPAGPKPAPRRRKFVHARSDDGRPKRSYDPSTWKHDT